MVFKRLAGICIALQNSGKVGKSLQRGTPASSFESEATGTFSRTHPSFCMTMLGRMQRKLWLISSIDGAGKCLYHSPYSPVLSPCDFDFIPKMKEPLCGIRFRAAPETLQAVDRSIRTINTTSAAEGKRGNMNV
ncbi:hypothetical protein AVEN_25724-1 [Araneus ventricosus]|uniref:Uncharacterized protein n=1 Tax=Araneus ventricosus TaxID=182803 RepID=A0A4Y2PMF6_ARAVE|nr:hypothetical protein AVEN_25724-1 [Araneus ventricosus]